MCVSTSYKIKQMTQMLSDIINDPFPHKLGNSHQHMLPILKKIPFVVVVLVLLTC